MFSLCIYDYLFQNYAPKSFSRFFFARENAYVRKNVAPNIPDAPLSRQLPNEISGERQSEPVFMASEWAALRGRQPPAPMSDSDKTPAAFFTRERANSQLERAKGGNFGTVPLKNTILWSPGRSYTASTLSRFVGRPLQKRWICAGRRDTRCFSRVSRQKYFPTREKDQLELGGPATGKCVYCAVTGMSEAQWKKNKKNPHVQNRLQMSPKKQHSKERTDRNNDLWTFNVTFL